LFAALEPQRFGGHAQQRRFHLGRVIRHRNFLFRTDDAFAKPMLADYFWMELLCLD
jgi:hypothetical protein